MFKKNPNRPPVVINFKKVPNGYRVVPNDALNPFSFKRITRAIFRSDLYLNNPQGQDNHMSGLQAGSTMIQPPAHITMPLSAQWFDMDEINQIEKQAFSEFFMEEDEEGRLFKKSPRLYKFYRNSIITLWRENSKKYLSPALCRKNLPGDVSSIIRIHGFLEHWGLINFPSKEHSRGYVASKPLAYSCLMCESSTCYEYYVAEVDDGMLLELCKNCFQQKYYPDCVDQQQFKKVIPELHQQKRIRSKMSQQEIKKMLQIIAAENGKEKEIWASLAKAFPNYSKQELTLIFLQLPSHLKSNANFFDSNEDFLNEIDPPSEEVPTIFEDYQDPEQTAVAMAYYCWKANPEGNPELEQMFRGATKHAEHLAAIQHQKSKQILRMLTDVLQSKIELKAVFIQQLEKLVQAEKKHHKAVAANLIAETLSCWQPEQP